MNNSSATNKSLSWLQAVILMIAVILVTVIITSWVIVSDIFISEFVPVSLNSEEERVLEKKLNILGLSNDQKQTESSLTIEPEPYTETDINREISLSEKELNAMLANNTDLASKLAIDLSHDLMSMKLLLPLDEQLPIFGGKTLKVTAGIEMSYRDSKPIIIVKGVSIWGVPIPGAYLGDIKNMDLIQEFGDTGFWKQFAEGLNDLQIEEGAIHIKVNN